MCVYACFVRACARMCVRACVSVCSVWRVYVFVWGCVCACVCTACGFVRVHACSVWARICVRLVMYDHQHNISIH